MCLETVHTTKILKIMNAIPYGRHHITEEDIQSVVEVIKSNNLTQGPKIAEFEAVFADYVGCKYVVAVSNGTAALHLSALALNTKPSDKITRLSLLWNFLKSDPSIYNASNKL